MASSTKAELLHDDLQVGLGGLVEVQPRDGALVLCEALAELLGRIRNSPGKSGEVFSVISGHAIASL